MRRLLPRRFRPGQSTVVPPLMDRPIQQLPSNAIAVEKVSANAGYSPHPQYLLQKAGLS